MIYVGVDPEPSGAYCIIAESESSPWEIVEFGTSLPNIGHRVGNFQQHIAKVVNNLDSLENDVIFIIEKLWAFHGQGITSNSKLMESFGAWQAIAYMYISINIPDLLHHNIYMPAPVTWKNALSKYFNLTKNGEPVKVGSDKEISYELVLSILEKNHQLDVVRKYLIPQTGVPKKQTRDRAEAFLLTIFGRLYLKGKLPGVKLE